METIEGRLKAMSLHSVQKKGGILSSQEYNKETKVQNKNKKKVLLKNKSQ